MIAENRKRFFFFFLSFLNVFVMLRSFCKSRGKCGRRQSAQVSSNLALHVTLDLALSNDAFHSFSSHHAMLRLHLCKPLCCVHGSASIRSTSEYNVLAHQRSFCVGDMQRKPWCCQMHCVGKLHSSSSI